MEVLITTFVCMTEDSIDFKSLISSYINFRFTIPEKYLIPLKLMIQRIVFKINLHS